MPRTLSRPGTADAARPSAEVCFAVVESRVVNEMRVVASDRMPGASFTTGCKEANLMPSAVSQCHFTPRSSGGSCAPGVQAS
jgi:hypothetical protein